MIYSEFAKLIIYEENPDCLGKAEQRKISQKLADRVFFNDNDSVRSPWNNLGRAFLQLEALGVKYEEERKEEDLNFLEEIKNVLDDIENQFRSH